MQSLADHCQMQSIWHNHPRSVSLWGKKMTAKNWRCLVSNSSGPKTNNAKFTLSVNISTRWSNGQSHPLRERQSAIEQLLSVQFSVMTINGDINLICRELQREQEEDSGTVKWAMKSNVTLSHCLLTPWLLLQTNQQVTYRHPNHIKTTLQSCQLFKSSVTRHAITQWAQSFLVEAQVMKCFSKWKTSKIRPCNNRKN